MKTSFFTTLLLVFNFSFLTAQQNNEWNIHELIKLTSQGNATISGKAFAKDNPYRYSKIKLGVFNFNKKQFPPIGTEVVLVPSTDYFDKWLKENKKRGKKNKEPIALDENYAKCIIKTTITDNEGHFEFKNLMTGNYWLITEFNFTHTNSTTKTVGYTNHYLNGMYIGSAPIEQIFRYNTKERAFATKLVKIKKENETIEVKLRDTDSLF